MLVLSREAGASLVIGDLLCTVIKLLPDRHAVALELRPVNTDPADPSQRRSVLAHLDVPVSVDTDTDTDTEVVLLDLRDDTARLGVTAPKEVSIHRLEVYEAIRRQHRGDDDSGPAGSRVPRPPTPRPPSLDVRLDEPPPAAGA